MEEILIKATSKDKTELNMYDKSIGDKQIGVIIKYLFDNATIITLDLRNNNIKELAEKYLSTNLWRNNIKYLGAKHLLTNLGHNNIKDKEK